MDDFLSALDSVDQEAMLQAQLQMGPASRLPSRTPDAGDTAGVGPVSRDLLTLPSKVGHVLGSVGGLGRR